MTSGPRVLPASGLITITNLVGGSNSSGTVTDTAAPGWGNSGYSSVESIVGDGWIQFVASEITTDRMIGISVTDVDQNFTTIEFAFYLEGGIGRILEYESGSNQGGAIGSYVNNVTVLKIAREGTQIKFYIDGVLAYTSLTTPSVGPYVVDTAMFTNGSTIKPITMSQ